MSDDPKLKLRQQLKTLLHDALDAPTEREPNRADPGASEEGPGSIGDERGGVRTNNPFVPRRLAESNRDAAMMADGESGNNINPETESIDSIPPRSSNVIPIKPGNEIAPYFPAHGQITPSQVRRCLTEHPDLIDVIKFDTYRGEVVKARTPPWRSNYDLWTDVDTEQLKCWLSDRYNIVYPNSSLEGVLTVVSHDNEFDSLQEEIKSFEWDGEPRIETWTAKYLCAEDTTYHREVGKRWLISAIARAMEPGCKADHVLVLEGWQGAFKSQAIEAIAGSKHYSDSPIDLNSSFAPQQLVGVWIYELAELAIKKAFGNLKTKAWLSAKFDDYSPKHMRRKIHQLRRNVWAASTNDVFHNDDPTGDRRSWGIWIDEPNKCKIDLIRLDRSQLLAEAYQSYLKYNENKLNGINDRENPFAWWLDDDNEALAREEQDKRYLADAKEEAISQWLAKNYDSILKKGFVTISEIMFYCFKMKPKDWDTDTQMQIARILTLRFKWKKGKRIRADGGRVYPYYPPTG